MSHCGSAIVYTWFMQAGVYLGVKGFAGADVSLGKRPRVDDDARSVKPCLGAGIQRSGDIGLALRGTAVVVTPLLLQLEDFSEETGGAVEVPSPGAPRTRPAV